MEAVTDQLDDAVSVLVCASPDERDEVLCERLLCDGAGAGRTVLWVSFGRSPADCLAGFPDETADRVVLAVGTPPTGPAVTDDSVSVDAVSTRSDLTALGIKLSRYLSSTDGALTVCFDSLTSLLDHVELATAYEFLHSVTRQCYVADGRIHFHLDATAHDDRSVAAITSLCDARVAFDHGPVVRTRTGEIENLSEKS